MLGFDFAKPTFSVLSYVKCCASASRSLLQRVPAMLYGLVTCVHLRRNCLEQSKTTWPRCWRSCRLWALFCKLGVKLAIDHMISVQFKWCLNESQVLLLISVPLIWSVCHHGSGLLITCHAPSKIYQNSKLYIHMWWYVCPLFFQENRFKRLFSHSTHMWGWACMVFLMTGNWIELPYCQAEGKRDH